MNDFFYKNYGLTCEKSTIYNLTTMETLDPAMSLKIVVRIILIYLGFGVVKR